MTPPRPPSLVPNRADRHHDLRAGVAPVPREPVVPRRGVKSSDAPKPPRGGELEEAEVARASEPVPMAFAFPYGLELGHPSGDRPESFEYASSGEPFLTRGPCWPLEGLEPAFLRSPISGGLRRGAQPR